MGILFIGSDAIMVNDAVTQVNRNICELERKLSAAKVKGFASIQVRSFYEKKIESQKVTLQWLEKAL